MNTLYYGDDLKIGPSYIKRLAEVRAHDECTTLAPSDYQWHNRPMFIPAGNYKIQTQTITHLVKEAPDRVVIYFMGDRTLELTGEVAGDFISQYEQFIEGKFTPEEEQRRAKQRNLKRR
jgi:hypothetical protein